MNPAKSPDPWFPYHVRRERAVIRLFCFPYAGGGASIYRPWGAALAPEIDVWPVQLPGRENRFRDPPVRDLTALVAQIATAIEPYLEAPFALFGHSMGALLAYELSRALRRRRSREPIHLIVSGREAPHIPSARMAPRDASDQAFIEVLQRLNGTPPEALAHPELSRLFLPIVRADLEAHEDYTHDPGDPLDCPITAFGGVDDPEVSHADLDAWRHHTRRPFAMRLFPGDHFFLRHEPTPVLRALDEVLRPEIERHRDSARPRRNDGR